MRNRSVRKRAGTRTKCTDVMISTPFVQSYIHINILSRSKHMHQESFLVLNLNASSRKAYVKCEKVLISTFAKYI